MYSMIKALLKCCTSPKIFTNNYASLVKVYNLISNELQSVMGINALIVNPLITDLIFSLARYSVKLSVNVNEAKILTSLLMR